MKGRNVGYLVLVIFMFSGVLSSAQATGSGSTIVGAIKDGIQVGPQGALEYSVPIDVPPATGGIAPKLAFAYNSASLKPGIMGVGWGLSGLSSISRCPQSRAVDGVPQAISFSNSDRFCMNGQELILVNPQAAEAATSTTPATPAITYGSQGSIYRTEIDSFARITPIFGVLPSSSGSTSQSTVNGIVGFTVEDKGGEISEYGNVTDAAANAIVQAQVNASQINSDGSPLGFPLTWALSRTYDAKGHIVTYQYGQPAGQAPQISKISYGYNLKNDSQATLSGITDGSNNLVDIDFSYIENPYTYLKYTAGNLYQQQFELKVVNIYQANSITAQKVGVKTYTLNYGQSNSDLSLELTGIQECFASGNCLPTSSYQWTNGVAGSPGVIYSAGTSMPETSLTKTLPNVYINGTGNFPMGTQVIDLNNDGLPDIIQMYCASPCSLTNTAGQQVAVYLNQGGGKFALDSAYTQSAALMAQAGVFLAVQVNFQGSNTVVDGGTRFVDINGDGLPDVFTALDPNEYAFSSLITSILTPANQIHKIYINKGPYFSGCTPGTTCGFAIDSSTYSTNISSSGATLSGGYFSVGLGWDGGMRIQDIDGDGLPDVLISNSTTCPSQNGSSAPDCFLRVGNAFQSTPPPSKSTIIGPGPATTTFVYLNKGPTTGFVYSSAYSSSLTNRVYFSLGGLDAGVRLVDVNGDGLPDIVQALDARVTTGTSISPAYFMYNPGAGSGGSGGQLYNVLINGGDSAGFASNSLYTSSLAANFSGVFSAHGLDGGTRLQDINGDGLPDLVQAFNPSNTFPLTSSATAPQVSVLLNTGMQFIAEGSSSVYATTLSNTNAYFSTNDSNNTHMDGGLRLIDINGDGLPDLVWGYTATSGGTTISGVEFNTGTGFSTSNPGQSITLSGLTGAAIPAISAQGVNQGVVFADFYGVGIPSLLQLNQPGSSQVLFSNLVGSPDLLTGTSVSYGASYGISYAPLTNSNVYTAATGDAFTNTLPQLDVTPPVYVVSKLNQSTGLGTGTDANTYLYGGLKYDANRGFVGFSWVESVDPNGRKSRTDYSQTYPYIGMATRQQQSWCQAPAYTACTLLSDTVNQLSNSYSFGSASSSSSLNVYFPYIQSTTTSTYEIPAAAASATSN